QKEGMLFLGNWYDYKAPFLFSTNGREYLEQIKTKSGIWFLDIRKDRNSAYPLKGWFSPQGLIDLYEKDLEEINSRLEQSDYEYLKNKNGLGLRDYQIEAIQEIENKLIKKPEDKRSLL